MVSSSSSFSSAFASLICTTCTHTVHCHTGWSAPPPHTLKNTATRADLYHLHIHSNTLPHWLIFTTCTHTATHCPAGWCAPSATHSTELAHWPVTMIVRVSDLPEFEASPIDDQHLALLYITSYFIFIRQCRCSHTTTKIPDPSSQSDVTLLAYYSTNVGLSR